MTQFDSQVNTSFPEDLIAIDTAAAEAGMSRSTLFRLIKLNQLQSYRRAGDRKTYVSRAELTRATGFRRA